MKVKFIKFNVWFAHDVDDVCELTDSDAEKLIESGHVVAVEELKQEKPAKSTKK